MRMPISSIIPFTTAAAIAVSIFQGGAAEKINMGFVYVGPKDDYGYNQAHSEGCQGVQKLDWVKAVEEANVPETTAVQETMRNMINLDGVRILFPTSFGYFDPHILKVAKQYPKVEFLHCGGLYTEGKHPKNVGSYFGYIDEAVYISGIVAGHATKSGKLGFRKCSVTSTPSRWEREVLSRMPPHRSSLRAIGPCQLKKLKPPPA